MKYINIKDIIGGDFRWWSMAGDQVHYTGHMHYNSPIETDSDCGNCNGANCDRCKKIIEKSHWEFGVATDELCEAIQKACPELTVAEAEDLAYNDFVSSIEHDGETYKIEWPTEAWMLENHPEIVDILSKMWHIVEIDRWWNVDDHHLTHTEKYYRFDTAEEAKKFFGEIYEYYRTTNPDYAEDYGGELSRYLVYRNSNKNNTLSSIDIKLRNESFENLRCSVWSADITYKNQILQYRNGKLENTITANK